jgi:hypothetical protein
MENKLLSDNFHEILNSFEQKNQDAQLAYINEKVEKNKKRIRSESKGFEKETNEALDAQDKWAETEKEKVKTVVEKNRERVYNSFYRKTNVKPQLVVLQNTLYDFKKHVMWYSFVNHTKEGIVACDKAFQVIDREKNPTPFFKRFRNFELHDNFVVNLMFTFVFGVLSIWAISSIISSNQNIATLNSVGVKEYVKDSEDTCNCSIGGLIDNKIAYYRDTMNKTTSYNSEKILTDAIRKDEIAKLMKQKEYRSEEVDKYHAIAISCVLGLITMAFFLPWLFHMVKSIVVSWPAKTNIRTGAFSTKYTLKQLKTTLFPNRESYGSVKCGVKYIQASKESLDNLTKIIDSGLSGNVLCHENTFEISNFPEFVLNYEEYSTAPHPIFYTIEDGFAIIYAGILEIPKMDKSNIIKSILSKLPTNLHELGRDLEAQGTQKGAGQLKELYTAFSGLTAMLGNKFEIDEKAYTSYLHIAKDLYEGGIDNLNKIKALLQTTGVIEVNEITERLNSLENMEGRTVKAEMEELKKRKKMRESTSKMVEDLFVENEQIINSILDTTVSLSQIKHSDDMSDDMIKEAMELLKEKALKSSELTGKPLNNK